MTTSPQYFEPMEFIRYRTQIQCFEERQIDFTVNTDVQFAEVHVVGGWKLYDDVSGWRQVGFSALQADSSTICYCTRVLTTHGVVSYRRWLHVCRYVRQTDDEIV